MRPGPDRLLRAVASARVTADEELHRRLRPQLTPARCADLDALVASDPARGVAPLVWLGDGATSASPEAIKAELAKLAYLRDLGAERLDLGVVPPERRRQLAALARRSTPKALRRMAAERRHPILLASLADTYAAVVDELVQMFDQALVATDSRARDRLAERELAIAHADVGRLVLLDEIIGVVLDDSLDDAAVGTRLHRLGRERLAAAARGPDERLPLGGLTFSASGSPSEVLDAVKPAQGRPGSWAAPAARTPTPPTHRLSSPCGCERSQCLIDTLRLLVRVVGVPMEWVVALAVLALLVGVVIGWALTRRISGGGAEPVQRDQDRRLEGNAQRLLTFSVAETEDTMPFLFGFVRHSSQPSARSLQPTHQLDLSKVAPLVDVLMENDALREELDAGNSWQMIVSDDARDGLESGLLQLMAGSEGSRGVVVDARTHAIVEHAQFVLKESGQALTRSSDPQQLVAGIVLLAVEALGEQIKRGFQQMNQRFDELKTQLAALMTADLIKRYAEAKAAHNIAGDAESILIRGGELTGFVDLAGTAHDLEKQHEACQIWLRECQQRLLMLRSDDGEGAGSAQHFLTIWPDVRDGRFQAEALIFHATIAARLRILVAQEWAASSADADMTMDFRDRLKGKARELRELHDQFSELLQALTRYDFQLHESKRNYPHNADAVNAQRRVRDLADLLAAEASLPFALLERGMRHELAISKAGGQLRASARSSVSRVVE